MSSADGGLLTLTRTLGTASTGLAAGLMLSLPIWTFPTVFTVQTLAPRDRLHIWSGIFDRGLTAIIPVLSVSLTSLIASSYLATPPPLWLGANSFAKNRKLVLGLASLLVFSNGPITAFLLRPSIEKLKKAEKDIIKNPEAANGTVETDSLIQEWIKYHWFRAVTTSTAFTLTILELVA